MGESGEVRYLFILFYFYIFARSRELSHDLVASVFSHDHTEPARPVRIAERLRLSTAAYPVILTVVMPASMLARSTYPFLHLARLHCVMVWPHYHLATLWTPVYPKMLRSPPPALPIDAEPALGCADLVISVWLSLVGVISGRQGERISAPTYHMYYCFDSMSNLLRAGPG